MHFCKPNLLGVLLAVLNRLSIYLLFRLSVNDIRMGFSTIWFECEEAVEEFI